MVACCQFNSKTMRPSCQSGGMLKLMWLWSQEEKAHQINYHDNIKRKNRRKSCYGIEKVSEAEMPGLDR